MALSIHVRPLLSHMHTLSPYVPNQSTCMYSQSTCTYCQSMCTYCQSTCVLSQSTCVHSIYCVLSMHMCSLAYRCFFPFPTDSDVRIDPFISLNTVCVQHIMVKMCGRESFALTHASWGFGDGDPSLLLIAFCLPLIAWLLLPSSLSPTNVHSFLMGSGFSLLCYFYPSVPHVYLIFRYQITNRWEVFAQKELSCPGSALPSRVTSSPCWLVGCPS